MSAPARPKAPAPPTNPGVRPRSDRIVSLDVFRGITIAAMILVNNPGSWDNVYWPLRHAQWHGWTLADLVFPSFLYIAGTALVFSTSRRTRTQTLRQTLLHTLCRSLALIAIGLVMNGLFYLPWKEVRLPGVLQRIGIVYLFASLITLTASRRARIIITAFLLLGYWALLALLSAPGHPSGDLSPHGNLASFVDRQLMYGHLWRRNWDPEGVLSTFPALATALLGTLAGDWLRSGKGRRRIAAGLIAAGGTGMVLGQSWSLVFPINKTLWTSSYVLLTAGIASLALGLCYWFLEVRNCRAWGHPFKLVGMNPLALYVASEIVGMSALDGARSWTFRNLLAPATGPMPASLLWALAYAGLWALVALLLYRRAIFIRL